LALLKVTSPPQNFPPFPDDTRFFPPLSHKLCLVLSHYTSIPHRQPSTPPRKTTPIVYTNGPQTPPLRPSISSYLATPSLVPCWFPVHGNTPLVASTNCPHVLVPPLLLTVSAVRYPFQDGTTPRHRKNTETRGAPCTPHPPLVCPNPTPARAALTTTYSCRQDRVTPRYLRLPAFLFWSFCLRL